jgi:hypothetical protein
MAISDIAPVNGPFDPALQPGLKKEKYASEENIGNSGFQAATTITSSNEICNEK